MTKRRGTEEDETELLNMEIAARREAQDRAIRESIADQRTFRVLVREEIEASPFGGVAMRDWVWVTVEAHGYHVTKAGALQFIRAVYAGNPSQGILQTVPYTWAPGMFARVQEITPAFQPRVN